MLPGKQNTARSPYLDKIICILAFTLDIKNTIHLELYIIHWWLRHGARRWISFVGAYHCYGRESWRSRLNVAFSAENKRIRFTCYSVYSWAISILSLCLCKLAM